jgi:hypothetical protein
VEALDFDEALAAVAEQAEADEITTVMNTPNVTIEALTLAVLLARL